MVQSNEIEKLLNMSYMVSFFGQLLNKCQNWQLGVTTNSACNCLLTNYQLDEFLKKAKLLDNGLFSEFS